MPLTIEHTKTGIKVTHPTGIVIVHTMKELEKHRKTMLDQIAACENEIEWINEQVEKCNAATE